ncbi:hypothetical protein N7478_011431 [Penicillium angulare]|uniref:uncharacterized protein n=1 Tax=Penicillium angulare TaxID=116970 RepID=UPI00253F8133|nr:uncharacterized protein N7478_011431 [Penicillium angulare]KAJ5263826.1 hypothetical protein N7478_011431 [Penicillium angulare]
MAHCTLVMPKPCLAIYPPKKTLVTTPDPRKLWQTIIGLESCYIINPLASVHPRVTGLRGADFTEVKNLEEARNSMKSKGIEGYDEIVRWAVKRTDARPRGRFYAVALGDRTGIFKDWKYELLLNSFYRGLTSNREVEDATKGVKYACQQCFDTEYEAREFIDDWNEAFADIWHHEIKSGLKDGWRARSLSLNLASVLVKENHEPSTETDMVSKFERLEVTN